MATYRVVTTGLPMPERINEAWQGPKLPGGLRPVAWRNAWTRAGETGKWGRVFGERRTMPTPEWVRVSQRELDERAKFAKRLAQAA